MANEAVLLPKEAEGVAGVFGMVVFSQLFACLLSLARGYNPDEPIGLSKTTVTFKLIIIRRCNYECYIVTGTDSGTDCICICVGCQMGMLLCIPSYYRLFCDRACIGSIGNLVWEAGAIAELSYLGLTTVGGTVPPNALIAGLMTVVLAYKSGVSAETALGLSLPFALLMQWIVNRLSVIVLRI